MNAMLSLPARASETPARPAGGPTLVRESCGSLPNQSSPPPLWRLAQMRTFCFRREDLERTHWQKVRRSLVED